jgi:hypothetical protein
MGVSPRALCGALCADCFDPGFENEKTCVDGAVFCSETMTTYKK